MKRLHVLKCLPQYFEVLATGEKTFEVRRDDRGFQRGDFLQIRKPESWETGEDLHFQITWILTGGQLGIEPGYVVLGLKRVNGAFDASS